MAGSLRQIQLKSKSIKNIQKLTNSMKMVAATRFKQAEKLLATARPLGVGARKFYDMFDREVEPKSNVHYLVPFTSDRGLCGSCHYKICKATTSRIDNKADYRIVCVGEKAKLMIGFTLGRYLTLVVNGIGHRNPTFKCASLIAMRLLGSNQFSEGTIYFAYFKNSLSYEVKQLRIHSTESIRPQFLHLTVDVENSDDIDSYAEFTLAALIFYALSESYGVELFSRMNAMAAASKNAGSLYQQLSGRFNQIRQNLITRDLIDIVSGASVVAVKKKRRPPRPGVAVESN